MDEAEQVKRYFTDSSEAFDSLYSESKTNPFTRYLNRIFRRDIYERFILTMEHVQKHKLKSVLDVGCGSGRYAQALAQLGVERIVGVDFSQKMIDLAVNNTQKIQRADKIFEFICSEFMEFQTEEKYDVVIAMGFFDYIKDPIPVLRKMQMLAKHSILASFPSTSFYRTPIRKVRYLYKQCPVYFYTRNKIELITSKIEHIKSDIVKIRGSGMDYFVTLSLK